MYFLFLKMTTGLNLFILPGSLERTVNPDG